MRSWTRLLLSENLLSLQINDILADIIDDPDFLEEIPDEAEIPNEANIPEQAEMPEDAVLDREILVNNDALFGPDEEELMGDVVIIAPLLNVADLNPVKAELRPT